jgi:hypothetical protein
MWKLALALAALVAATPAYPQSFSLYIKNPPPIDAAAWIYQGNYGLGLADVIQGTRERIDVLPPNIATTQSAVGIELFRRSLDTAGYPMRISLVEKLFAATQKLEYVVLSTSEGGREYDTRQPAYGETVLHGPAAGAFRASGPAPANGPIIAEYQPAFAYATRELAQLSLPADQKDLAHYVVMFIDTPGTTWVEFGPAFAPGETPHLGCQTQLGRDMVFGYVKDPAGAGVGGPFIACF